MPLDYAYLDQCVDWPVLPADAPPPMSLSAGAKYPDVPVLVISGELDNMTPSAGAQEAAAHFAHAYHLIVANGFHDNAQPHSRSECGEVIARRFLDTLAVGDVSCAAATPPVRLVPRFACEASALEASWPEGVSGARATVRGTLGGRAVAAEACAP